jgi:hypothetical protein
MAIKKIQRTGFQSDIDLFLQDFNKNRTKIPASVQKEVKKHQAIFAKRDGVVDEKESAIWKDF